MIFHTYLRLPKGTHLDTDVQTPFHAQGLTTVKQNPLGGLYSQDATGLLKQGDALPEAWIGLVASKNDQKTSGVVVFLGLSLGYDMGLFEAGYPKIEGG